jgi:exopolysaccharide production protein ExoQ
MSTTTITVICLAWIAWALARDVRQPHPGVDPTLGRDAPRAWALWLPLAWMFVAGSRLVSSWFQVSPGMSSAASFNEGSPVDRAFFLTLILLGLAVLFKRRAATAQVLRHNRLLIIYFAYCLLSIAWSDEPFVGFKRWYKDLGNLVMVLVILTDAQPLQALSLVLRRLTVLFIPLSLLFVKFHPSLGRAFHVDGTAMYIGIGSQKNDLGLMCLLAGTYAVWQVVQQRQAFKTWRWLERWQLIVLAGLTLWLLVLSDSQTSLVCLIISSVVVLGSRLPGIRQRPARLVPLLTLMVAVGAWLHVTTDIKAQVLAWLGRNETLTNRTDLWEVLNTMVVNPTLGAGYMSFWTGPRMEDIWQAVGANVNQAHNGYLEQYLNLGWVGVGFMGLLLSGALWNIWRTLSVDASMGVLRLTFLLTALAFNLAEASFYGINNMWVLTLIAMVNPVPKPRPNMAPKPSSARASSKHREASRVPRFTTPASARPSTGQASASLTAEQP